MTRTGVLLTAFGGPDCIEAVGPFMSCLMGREPSPELVRKVELRYLTIGGASPLPATAGALAEALEKRLAELDPGGDRVPARVGMRYSAPWIKDAFSALVDAGCERIVTLSLSPFESTRSSGAYREAVDEVAARYPDIEVVEAPSFHLGEGFLSFLADAARAARTDAETYGTSMTIFTAHSLPLADIGPADTYVEQLRQTVAAIVERIGLASPREGAVATALPGLDAFGGGEGTGLWLLAYQSKGAQPGEWLGPDLDDVIDAAAAAGMASVAVCPVGFATDHMETLYDLDVVAAERALGADIEFARGAVPNDDQQMIASLAAVVLPLLNSD